MEKINFENKPSTNSPINATNLNLLQDNIEDDIMNVKNSIGNLEDLTISSKNNIVSAINETNENIPRKTSDLTNDSAFLTKISISLAFSSLDELKNYMISNSVPSQAVNLFHISLSGAGKGLMIQKTNNLYLSFILWGYSGDCTLYKYVNGTWYEKDL